MIKNSKCFLILFIIIIAFANSLFSQQSKIDSLELILKKVDQAEKADLLNKLAKSYLSVDANTGLNIAGKALEISDELEQKKEHIDALQNIADSYFELSRFQPAIEFYMNTLNELADQNNTELNPPLYTKIGHCEKLLSNYESALLFYNKALDIYKKTNNENLIAGSYNNIGTILKLQGNYTESLSFHQKALKSYVKLGNQSEISNTLNYIGSLFWNISKYDSSLIYYEKSLEIKREINDYSGEAIVLSNIGVLYKDKGEFQKALEYHSKALEIKQEIGNNNEIAASINNIGSVYLKNNNYEKALEFYNKSLEIRQKLNNIFEIAQSQSNIALVYKNLNDFQNALEFYNQSLNNLKKVGNKSHISNCLNQIGSIYAKQNKYDLALENYLNALKLRQEIDDQSLVAASLINIGIIYDEIGNYEKALEFYNKSLAIKTEFGDSKDIAYTLQITGNTYLKLKRYDEALENFIKALEIRERIGDKVSIASSLKSLGSVYLELGDHTKSLIYYNEALKTRDEIGDALGVSEILNELGNYYNSISDYNKALDFFEQTIKLSKKTGEQFRLALSYRKAGEILILKNKTTEGVEYINKSLEIGQQINHFELIKNAYYSLYQHYYKSGDKSRALDNYINYSIIKDSILAKTNNQRIIETQMKFEIEKSQSEINRIENEIDELTADKKIKDLEIQKQKNLRDLLIVISFLSVLTFFLILRQFILKRKTNKLLNAKIKEVDISNKLLRESETNLKVLNATKDKFFSIIAHDLKNPFNALYGLTEHIYKNFENYSQKELKEYINIIHNSAEQLLELLENLLHWSRTQRGKMQFNPISINLAEMISQAIALQKISADKKEITLKSTVNQSHIVFADPDMLKAIFRNLISNAIKFSNLEGIVQIIAEQKNDCTEISVIDNGVGIAKEDIEKLFRIDIHYSTSGTSEEQGSGLGLILCHEFVEKHNGKIWVESEISNITEGKPGGSTFKFTIPNK